MKEEALFTKDYSFQSVHILTQKSREVLQKHTDSQNIWIIDSHEKPLGDQKQEVDIIFFGDFFRKFLTSENWPFEKYRFWVIGSPAKNFFINILKIPERCIAQIPREELFQNFSFQSDLKSLTEQKLTLIYAGRMSPLKRIMTQLWSVYYLQKKYKLNVDFHLYGEFINESEPYGTSTIGNYKDDIIKMITDLDWQTKPSYWGKVSSNEWSANNFVNPIYYSLSVLPFEDFSVSCAQAQEKGWPCIVNYWGGFRDLNGQVLHLPTSLFQTLTESKENAERDAEFIADYIAKSQFQKIPPRKKLETPQQVLTKNELKVIRENFFKKWQIPFQVLIDHRTDGVKKSPQWQAFLYEYIRCFTDKV